MGGGDKYFEKGKGAAGIFHPPRLTSEDMDSQHARRSREYPGVHLERARLFMHLVGNHPDRKSTLLALLATRARHAGVMTMRPANDPEGHLFHM